MKATLIKGYSKRVTHEDISHLPEQQRANIWIVKGETGSSSKAIWAHMVGVSVDGYAHSPSDPADLNRCLLLLEAVPEWKERMHEMAAHGGEWVGLSARWDELTHNFISEVGLNWCKGDRAPTTYALMKEVTAVSHD